MTGHRDRTQEALDSGWSFAGLYAVASDGPVRVVLAGESGEMRIETVDPVAGAVPSIVDLVPASGWDEREAHDLYGVRFDGHEPLRPLVEHDLDVARWTVPVQGRDAYQVAVGPIHAGVIESGHFRFHLVGEKILHLDARLFYKHRGLERAAEGTSLEEEPATSEERARRVRSRTGSRTRRQSRKRSASRRRPTSAGHARSSSSSSVFGAT